MSMNIFAQITKVDEEKRLVFGRAAQEMVDKSDEVMDYLSSKPHFEAWSAEIAKDTGGKSMGNVRAMHGKVSAGKLTQIDFNDADKAIDVVAKIVDDQEWKKVNEGCYTGFSIGGSYVGPKTVEKSDGKDVTRYTAKPTEISLVDRPCIPSAKFFEVQKADGAVEKVDFKNQPEADAEKVEDVDPDDVTVEGTADEVALLGKTMNDAGLNIGAVIEMIKAWPPSKKDAKAAEDAKAAADAKAADEEDKEAEPDGDECADEAKKAEKVEKVDAPVAKLDEAALQKIVADALAPLQKALEDATAKIIKLEAQPATPRVMLRAISKADDLGGGDTEASKLNKAEPIIDDRGDPHEAAGLIKNLHRYGGAPLTVTQPLRK
jgi:hypothetical protein